MGASGVQSLEDLLNILWILDADRVFPVCQRRFISGFSAKVDEVIFMDIPSPDPE